MVVMSSGCSRNRKGWEHRATGAQGARQKAKRSLRNWWAKARNLESLTNKIGGWGGRN